MVIRSTGIGTVPYGNKNIMLAKFLYFGLFYGNVLIGTSIVPYDKNGNFRIMKKIVKYVT